MIWIGIIIGVLIGVIGLWGGLSLYGRHLQKQMSIAELVAPHAQLFMYIFLSDTPQEIWDLSRLEEDNIVTLQIGMTAEEVSMVQSLLPILRCFADVAIYYYPASQEFDFKFMDENGGFFFDD